MVDTYVHGAQTLSLVAPRSHEIVGYPSLKDLDRTPLFCCLFLDRFFACFYEHRMRRVPSPEENKRFFTVSFLTVSFSRRGRSPVCIPSAEHRVHRGLRGTGSDASFEDVGEDNGGGGTSGKGEIAIDSCITGARLHVPCMFPRD